MNIYILILTYHVNFFLLRNNIALVYLEEDESRTLFGEWRGEDGMTNNWSFSQNLCFELVDPLIFLLIFKTITCHVQ